MDSMTTDGGGWQICYTTRDKVRIANEVTYSYPYASHGYRSDCRNTVFNDVIAINHDNGQVAWFKQQSRSTFKFSSTNYFTTGSAYGLWTGFGVAATSSWSYQMGICDSGANLAPGLWMSGWFRRQAAVVFLLVQGTPTAGRRATAGVATNRPGTSVSRATMPATMARPGVRTDTLMSPTSL